MTSALNDSEHVNNVVLSILKTKGQSQIICPPIIAKKAAEKIIHLKTTTQAVFITNTTDKSCKTLNLADFIRSVFSLAFNVPGDQAAPWLFSDRLMQPDCLHEVQELVASLTPLYIIDVIGLPCNILETYPLFAKSNLVVLTPSQINIKDLPVVDLKIPNPDEPEIININRDHLFDYCKTKIIICDEYFYPYLYALNDVSSHSLITKSPWIAKMPKDIDETSIYDAVLIVDRLSTNAIEFVKKKVESTIYMCHLCFEMHPPSIAIKASMAKNFHHLFGLFVADKLIISYFHALLHYHGFAQHSLLLLSNPRIVKEENIRYAKDEIDRRGLQFTIVTGLNDVSASLISPSCANDVVKTCQLATDLTAKPFISYNLLISNKSSMKMKPKYDYRLQVIRSYAELYNECMKVSKSSGIIISELEYNSKWIFTKNDLLTFISYFNDGTWGSYVCCPPKYKKFYKKYLKNQLKLISDRIKGDILTPLAQAPTTLLKFVQRENVHLFDPILLDFNHLTQTVLSAEPELSNLTKDIVDSFTSLDSSIFRVVEAISRYPNSVPWISTFVMTPPASLVGNHLARVPILIPVGPILKVGGVHILSATHFLHKKIFIILPWPDAECEMILVNNTHALIISKIADFLDGKEQPVISTREDALTRWFPSDVDASLLRRFLFVYCYKNLGRVNRYIRQLAEAFPANIDFKEKVISKNSNIEWDDESHSVKIDEYEICYSELPSTCLRNTNEIWSIVKQRIKYLE